MMTLQMILIAHFMGYLHEEGDYSLTEAGFYLSLVLLGGMIGRVGLAWISDQFAQKREQLLILVMLSTVIFAISLPLILHFKNLMIIYCFLFGFIALGWYSLFITCVTEKSNPHYVGLTVSAALTINQLFIVIAPSLYGFMVTILSSHQLAMDSIAGIVALGALNLYRSTNKTCD